MSGNEKTFVGSTETRGRLFSRDEDSMEEFENQERLADGMASEEEEEDDDDYPEAPEHAGYPDSDSDGSAAGPSARLQSNGDVMVVQVPAEPPPAYSSLQSQQPSLSIKNALFKGGMMIAGVGAIRSSSSDVRASLDSESAPESPAVQQKMPFQKPRPVDQSPLVRRDSTPSPVKPSSYTLTSDLKSLIALAERYQAIGVPVQPQLMPFDINFVPAVGDVHPGIGVPRPDGVDDQLGVVVLDEPSSKQTDSTVINLIMQKENPQTAAAVSEPVKKLQRADRNAKQIDQWINNIKEVRRSMPPTRMAYTMQMPEIERLMEEWDPQVDAVLGEITLPTAELDVPIEDFVDICLAFADIPMRETRIQSLHVLFTLYNEFKNSQHFRNIALDGDIAAETNRLEL